MTNPDDLTFILGNTREISDAIADGIVRFVRSRR